MPDIIKRIRIDELTGARVGMDRRETEIAHMVGTAMLIEQNIPVHPPVRAGIEIVDHRIAIALPERPVLQTVKVEFLFAPFGKEQMRSGKSGMYKCDIIEL